jgi:hypothetical protein
MLPLRALSLALVVVAQGSLALFRRGSSCLPYEPAKVSITGRLTVRNEYGPPNYGETPAQDEKLRVPILELARPADICANPTGDVDRETYHNLREIQLNFAKQQVSPEVYLSRRLNVRGTLYQAISGYHFTKVLMMVDSVTPSAVP